LIVRVIGNPRETRGRRRKLGYSKPIVKRMKNKEICNYVP